MLLWRNFADIFNQLTLKLRDNPGGTTLIKQTLYSKDFSLAGHRKGNERCQVSNIFAVSDWRWRRLHGKECGQLLGARSGPGWSEARNRTSIARRWIFASSKDKLAFPQISHIRTQLGLYLDILRREPSQAVLDLQNSKLVNGCCYKPLGLW